MFSSFQAFLCCKLFWPQASGAFVPCWYARSVGLELGTKIEIPLFLEQLADSLVIVLNTLMELLVL